MPSTYNGVPGDITMPAVLSISSSTNASPIVVTTTAPHGLHSGDLVSIYSHQTNTNANGANLTIVVLGASTFSITGSSGNGVGGATGTVQPLTYGSAANIPSDGDARNAASVNVPFEALFDRTSKVIPFSGYQKRIGRVDFQQQGLTSATWALFSGTLASSTATAMTLSALSVVAPSGGTIVSIAAGGPYGVSGMLNGDFARVSLRCTSVQGSTLDFLYVALFYAFTAPGAGGPAFGSFASVPTASCTIGCSVAGEPRPVYTEGWTSSALGVNGADMYVQPVVYSAPGGSVSLQFQNEAKITIEVFRATGVPQ